MGARRGLARPFIGEHQGGGGSKNEMRCLGEGHVVGVARRPLATARAAWRAEKLAWVRSSGVRRQGGAVWANPGAQGRGLAEGTSRGRPGRNGAGVRGRGRQDAGRRREEEDEVGGKNVNREKLQGLRCKLRFSHYSRGQMKNI